MDIILLFLCKGRVLMELMTLKRLTPTDVKYRIMQCAKELNIPHNTTLEVHYFPVNGKKQIFGAKTHSQSTGRVDGMREFFDAVNPQVGDMFIVRYVKYLEVIAFDQFLDDVVLNPSDLNYNIFTCGSSINIPQGAEIGFYAYINKKPNYWSVKTHKTVKGRSDGLSEFYKEYASELKAGKKFTVIYVPYIHIQGHENWKGILFVFDKNQKK